LGKPIRLNLLPCNNFHQWQNNHMKFDELMAPAARLPFFEIGLILAGAVNPANVRRQLSRRV
jgi:hypothetical protein